MSTEIMDNLSEENSGAVAANKDVSSQSTPITVAATAASPIDATVGEEGGSADNGKEPPLITNGASNHSTNDADQTAVTVSGKAEGSNVAVDEQPPKDMEQPPVTAKSTVQEEAPVIKDAGVEDQKDGVKIKTTIQSEVDVEMISTEMIDENTEAQAKLKPNKASGGSGGGRHSRPSTPSKMEPQQPSVDDDDDDDDDEYDIPPHLQKKQTIAETSPAERYIRFKEKLGSGAYKDVYRAYDTIEGIEVAWNVVKLGGVPKAERVRIVNEVRLLERLHHPNIISFHGSWVNRETERVIFVTEILSSGTLKSFVQKVQLIRWKIFKRWTIQILKGLEYLHSQDPPIIHRDLKCDNIFINGTSGDLRIGDFGLSTAISKKNQPLSVLGTPEFMAPELYDESYDEKVDIYAFGMLLLEIITRDVPYHECANPAQIYKKVTQGIPPASLRRVKSEDARNFILFCLGIDKDASERPSASELLKHPFLAKKPDDETTIEVEPAVEDIVIEETLPEVGSESGSERSRGDSLAKGSKYSSSLDGHGLPPRKSGDVVSPINTPVTAEDAPTPDENEDQTEDQFDGMQQNEANMKKVTVLMGRGTALDDDDSPRKDTSSDSLSKTESLSNTTLQYKVSAVPRLDFVEGKEPYPNDEIDLALTLPDESRTTIEFEFDLVNDDPVQVAREMVTELEEVPDCAVLDISGAISGVARDARMKQNQWKKLQQQQSALAQQGMMMHNQGSMMPPQGMQGQPPQVQQQGMMMPQQQIYNPTSGYPSGSGYPSSTALQQHQQQQQIQPQQMGLVQPPISGEAAAPPPAPQPQMPILQQQQQPPPPPTHIQTPAPPAPPQQSTISATPDLSAQLKSPAPAMPIPQQHHQQPQLHAPQQQVPPPPQQSTISSQSPLVRPNSMGALSNHTAHLTTPAQQQLQQGTPMVSHPSPSLPTKDPSIKTSQSHNALHEGSPAVKVHKDPVVLPMIHQEQSEHSTSISSVGDKSPSDGNLSEDLDVDSEVDAEEIRRLEQEFEKKLQRAKKSYGTRMDNLHRSKEEAEAQHQMTLEKHEKERIEFEKRVRLAEEEQTRRLNQLEKEFIEKKKEFMKAGTAPSSNTTTNGEQQTPHGTPHGGGHKRSNSHVTTTAATRTTPSSSDHKRNVSTSEIDETQGTRERSESMKGQLPPKLPPRTDLPPKFPKPGRERSGSRNFDI